MKKMLTVFLSLALAFTLSAAVLSVSAKDNRDHWSENSNYEAGNAIQVYQDFVSNNRGTGGSCTNVENLFGDAYKGSWIASEGALKIADDGTATMYPTSMGGHVLKNYKYGYGTFLMTFKIDTNENINPNEFITGSGEETTQFWGIEFGNTSKVGSVWGNLSVPWTSQGGYPYHLCFDGEKGPATEENVIGTDGKATLPDGTLVSEAREEDPEGEYGRIYQTGLTLRRYKYGGSHNYYRWSTTNPTKAIYKNSINEDCHSMIPDLYREVRLEDVWNKQEHTLLCQFRPLSVDNGDGIDAMLIDVWMSGLDAKDGDETQVVNGKTMVHVLRVYDDMPYDDIDNEGVQVDKRTADGSVVLWTHDDYSYSQNAAEWNSKISISEFYMLNGGSYADYDVNNFTELTGQNFLGGSVTYDGEAHGFNVTTTGDDISVLFYDEDGKLLAEGKDNAPTFTEAGVHTVTAKFLKSQHKPQEITQSVTIGKARPRMDASARQQVKVGEAISASVTYNNQEVPELTEALHFSPANKFNQEGYYTVIISLPETANYQSASKKVTVQVTSDGGSSGGLKFTDEEIAAMSWVPVGLDENHSATYNGEEHGLYLTGLPAGATVEYENNVMINAGEHTVRATIKKDGYDDYTVSTSMNIAKAAVTITADAEQTFFYSNADLVAKAIASNGATVEIQKVKEIGKHTVKLTVAESENYLAAELTITVTVKLNQITD